MYLRRVLMDREYHYMLRESFLDGEVWKHRNLLDLGEDPTCYIVYPGGNGYYFKPELEDRLEAQGVQYRSEDLEEVFLPFMDPHIRRIIENFSGRECTENTGNTCSQEELLQRQSHLHSFDRRRLHYLRCGRVDIGRLEGRSWKFLNVLLEKSRDEIEHTIEQMEQRLRPHEVRPYLFTAFHLQLYFPHHLMRNEPTGLDPERVDNYFLEEICRLNEDKTYFRGMEGHNRRNLHPYLRRYVILYFDHDFSYRPLWNRYISDFMNQRRFYHAPRQHPQMDTGKACGLLGLSTAEFEKMSARDLIRHYRREAKKMHPDTGGSHEDFVAMNEAYESLLRKKRRAP